MLITVDSERTSNPTPTPTAPFVTATGRDYVGQIDVPSVIVSRRSFGADVVFGCLDRVSSARELYHAQVQVNSPTGMSFLNATIGKVADIVGTYCVRGASESLRRRMIYMPWLTLGAEIASVSSIEAWAPGQAALVSVEMNRGLDHLRGIVSSIRQRSPLQLSQNVERLIDQAARRRGTPDEVADWARTIADDVADLTD